MRRAYTRKRGRAHAISRKPCDDHVQMEPAHKRSKCVDGHHMDTRIDGPILFSIESLTRLWEAARKSVADVDRAIHFDLLVPSPNDVRHTVAADVTVAKANVSVNDGNTSDVGTNHTNTDTSVPPPSSSTEDNAGTQPDLGPERDLHSEPSLEPVPGANASANASVHASANLSVNASANARVEDDIIRMFASAHLVEGEIGVNAGENTDTIAGRVPASEGALISEPSCTDSSGTRVWLQHASYDPLSMVAVLVRHVSVCMGTKPSIYGGRRGVTAFGFVRPLVDGGVDAVVRISHTTATEEALIKRCMRLCVASCSSVSAEVDVVHKTALGAVFCRPLMLARYRGPRLDSYTCDNPVAGTTAMTKDHMAEVAAGTGPVGDDECADDRMFALVQEAAPGMLGFQQWICRHDALRRGSGTCSVGHTEMLRCVMFRATLAAYAFGTQLGAIHSDMHVGNCSASVTPGKYQAPLLVRLCAAGASRPPQGLGERGACDAEGSTPPCGATNPIGRWPRCEGWLMAPMDISGGNLCFYDLSLATGPTNDLHESVPRFARMYDVTMFCGSFLMAWLLRPTHVRRIGAPERWIDKFVPESRMTPSTAYMLLCVLGDKKLRGTVPNVAQCPIDSMPMAALSFCADALRYPCPRTVRDCILGEINAPSSRRKHHFVGVKCARLPVMFEAEVRTPARTDGRVSLRHAAWHTHPAVQVMSANTRTSAGRRRVRDAWNRAQEALKGICSLLYFAEIETTQVSIDGVTAHLAADPEWLLHHPFFSTFRTETDDKCVAINKSLRYMNALSQSAYDGAGGASKWSSVPPVIVEL